MDHRRSAAPGGGDQSIAQGAASLRASPGIEPPPTLQRGVTSESPDGGDGNAKHDLALNPRASVSPTAARPRTSSAITSNPMRPLALFILLAILALLLAPRLAPPAPPARPSGPTFTTPPAPILSPESALAAIKIVPGLQVSLAASEPAIQAPVAGTFDEDGRLWLVEMPSYMPDTEATNERVPTGKILILEDRDHDGVFETVTTFLDHLVLPRSVAPCFGGALVLEPPDLYYCPDENHDGRADSKLQLLSNFAGLDNPEHAGNAITYGLDNWYHLSQHNLEFRFDGQRITTRPTPNHGQWGLTLDDQGRLYYTPNSDPLLFDAFPKHYASRNPALENPAGLGEPIGKGAEVTWPSRPTPGVNRGYMPGTLRPNGTLASLTAACGPSFYSADLLGPDYPNNIFICEPAGLLVKRLTLSDTPTGPRARNAYTDSEFLTSTDERFRPVDALTGPDGALYLLDMARGVIQHKTYATPYLKDQIYARNLEHPLDLGRVWRIAPPNSPIPPAPHLSTASTSDLVSLLSHPDSWWRLTAQRLLVQRRATDAAPALRALANSSAPPIPRLHALWTLEGLDLLQSADTQAAMSDSSPLIRAAGIRLSEPFLAQPPIATRVRELSIDPERSVRLQAALSLGESRDDASLAALADFLRRDAADPVIRSAVVSGLRTRETSILNQLLTDPTWPQDADAYSVLALLTDTALRDSREQRSTLIERAGSLAQSSDPRAWLLVSRIRDAQHLTAVTPRILDLAREPQPWMTVTSSPLSPLISESAVYFDWPGRPPVHRPKNLRPLTPAERALSDKGAAIFETVCAVCHQPTGQGAPGLAPPLAGSARVEGPTSKLARILLNGYTGEYRVGTSTFQGEMPAPPLATDEDAAAVMTYIRRAWGNTAEAVSPQSIARVRAQVRARTTPWTKQELDPPGGFPP